MKCFRMLQIGASHWAFDSNSISKRNHTGENESWFLKHWNDHLKEKFHLKKDLTGVFIDVFKDPQDADQQAVFQVSFHMIKLLIYFKNLTIYSKTIFRMRLENYGTLLNKIEHFLSRQLVMLL